MKIAVLQMTAGIDPAANAAVLVDAVVDAKASGAVMLFTPEMSGLLDRDGERAATRIVPQDEDAMLRRVRDAARDAALWVHLGSLAVAADDGGPGWHNRGFVIDDAGAIRATYDKLHLFDVDLPTGESWRESARYRRGAGAIVAETPVGPVGLSICYDIRFPALYQALSVAGARVLAVPAAFTVPTGDAHWHVLLRARAIENACFVVAAAQAGHHADGRTTYGRSLVVDPWGRVLLDMGDGPGLACCELDLGALADVRARLPVLLHRRNIPTVSTR